jgi:hypothetical protein
MAQKIGFFILYLMLFNISCKGKTSVHDEIINKEQIKILIPFLPASCHQCDIKFYNNLKLLDAQKIDYSIILSDDFSDDLEHVIKEYNLSKYNVKNYLFSSNLFDKYHIYEQSYVLQFGVDSNYKIYDNAKALLKDLQELNNAEKIDLNGYIIKKSTSSIRINGKNQICVRNSVLQNMFDFIDLNNKKPNTAISFTEEQLLNHYVLYFKDSIVAKNKLSQTNSVLDIPNKNTFDQAIFHNDSLFIFSNHTFINSLTDSTLGGFMIMNIYKDGKYLSARSFSRDSFPIKYTFLPHFHLYNNKLYIKLVKENMEADKPNYFLGMFELEGGVYKFKKLLNFTVPAIHNDVGYTFLELKFSGKYLMTSISNELFNLESEQIETLNIPVNKKFELNNLLNNLKGVDVLIDNIHVRYPNILITYLSKDNNGVGINTILNYDLEIKNIVGKIQMPLDNSRFLKPDLSKFGYFMWTPKNGVNDYLIYKKLY